MRTSITAITLCALCVGITAIALADEVDHYVLTTGYYAWHSDMDAAVVAEFGPDAAVADWADLKASFTGRIAELCDAVGLTSYADDAFVYRNGSAFWSGNRHYFFARHNGSVPGNWLVHDGIDNYTVTLGSWYHSCRILVHLPSSVGTETTSSTVALTETIFTENATLTASVTGDFDAELSFSELEFVTVKSGSFAGKGFSKGSWSTNLEGIPYNGNWQGVVFKKPAERKIYLKGVVSGGMKGIVEGFLSESVIESDVYDQYDATWTISHIGGTLVFAKLDLDGTIDYVESVEYPDEELYALQTAIEGGSFGSLGVVLTHIRIDDEANPYYGQGFSMISYTSDSGTGEGWTYDEVFEPGKVRLKGMFTSPLWGIVSGTLDETQSPRKLILSVQRVDAGLPPAPDLNVKVWGPGRVSPGQTINYIIEYRNDGLKPAEEAIVFYGLDPSVTHISASAEADYNEFYHTVSWRLGETAPKSAGLLSVKANVSWGLSWRSTLDSSAYIIEPSTGEPGSPNLYLNGVNTPADSAYGIKASEFAEKLDAAWAQIYPSPGLLGAVIDSLHVQMATPDYRKIIGYDEGKPVIGYDSETGYPIYAPPDPERITTFDGDQYYIYFTRSDENGLTKQEVVNAEYQTVVAFSGGTRTALTAILHDDLICQRLILISPMAGIMDWGRYKWELEQVHEKHPGMQIVIYQSSKDLLAWKFLSWLFQAKFGPWDADWLAENNIVANPEHLEVNGKTLTIDGEEINKQNHGGLFNYLNDILNGDPGMSASQTTDVAVAHDPNIKYGPDGDVQAGQTLDYRVEYENEGEGIAFGVYFTDTLDGDLDDATLQIGEVISIADGSVIAPAGHYNALNRTITWFVGEVGPGEGGYADISVNVRDDAVEGDEIINFGIVYFPSVPEVTRTNGIVNRVTEVVTLEATIDIDPDTINVKSKGNYITCYIELPADYDVNDIKHKHHDHD